MDLKTSSHETSAVTPDRARKGVRERGHDSWSSDGGSHTCTCSHMRLRLIPGTRVRLQLHWVRVQLHCEARLRFLVETFSQPLQLPFALVHFSMR